MKVYNPNLPKEIVDELYRLNDQYFQFDKPIPFKEGLFIYPVNVRNHDEFLVASECLTLDKMSSVEGIQTSNLGYLLLKMNDKENPMEAAKFSQYLIRICELVFHIKYGVRCVKCGKVYDYYEFLTKAMDKEHPFHCECWKDGEEEDFDINIKYKLNEKTKQRELLVNGVCITPKEFDLLRQIIMYQNLPDYKDDSWVDPEMREDQKKKQELLAKKNKTGSATLERKIVCMAAKSSYTINEIYELTMRKFIMLLSAIDDAMNYECTRIGLMTGMVSTKEPLEHWIYKKESEDLYGDAVTLDDMTKEIGSAV